MCWMAEASERTRQRHIRDQAESDRSEKCRSFARAWMECVLEQRKQEQSGRHRQSDRLTHFISFLTLTRTIYAHTHTFSVLYNFFSFFFIRRWNSELQVDTQSVQLISWTIKIGSFSPCVSRLCVAIATCAGVRVRYVYSVQCMCLCFVFKTLIGCLLRLEYWANLRWYTDKNRAVVENYRKLEMCVCVALPLFFVFLFPFVRCSRRRRWLVLSSSTMFRHTFFVLTICTRCQIVGVKFSVDFI